ncbi:28593_t:CDS:2, partial [Dentiscutata erythropus]
ANLNERITELPDWGVKYSKLRTKEGYMHGSSMTMVAANTRNNACVMYELEVNTAKSKDPERYELQQFFGQNVKNARKGPYGIYCFEEFGDYEFVDVSMIRRCTTNRRRRTEVLERHLGLQFDYYKAVNKYDNIAISRVKGGLDLGVKSCYLSHYLIYQLIIDNEYENALILEDDIDMELNITNILTDIYPHLPNDWDVLYVGHCGESKIEMTVANVFGFELRKTGNPLCTHGYAVSSSGARKLVKKLNIDNPTVGIDFELLKLIHSGNITSYSINPPIIIQFKTSEDLSDITPGKFAMRLPLFNSTLLHLGYKRDY